jgi:hypothetical protein
MTAGAAYLLSVLIVRIMVTLTNAGPRNPVARHSIRLWLGAFGLIMVVSILTFGWLRFVEDTRVLAYVSVPLVGFEASVFSLTAGFESLRVVYSWSADITDQYEQLSQELSRLRAEDIERSVDLDDLRYRLKADSETNRASVEKSEEVQK